MLIIIPHINRMSLESSINCECKGVQNLTKKLQEVLPSVQFSSVAQSCLTFCDPMNRNMPGLPVHHQLPEFTQTHVHRVGDAIQPSHPLSSPSPPAPNPSQHQSLFQWVNSSLLSPSICHKVMRLDAMILVVWMLNFKPTLSLSSIQINETQRGDLRKV